MKKYTVPLGRMADYPHPHPERTGIKASAKLFADCTCVVFPSRVMLVNACKIGGMTALVKDTVPANMLTCPRFQKPA